MTSVLIIEDDERMKEGFVMVLEAHGFAVRTAENGAEGLEELANGFKPDLILLDLMMPVMNGWQFREAQLADARIRDIPIVVITGHSDAEKQVRSLRPAACLQKPFPVPMMLAAISKIISGASSTPAANQPGFLTP